MNDLWERLDPGFFKPAWLAVGALALLAIVLLDLGAAKRRRRALAQLAAAHIAAELTASVSIVKRRIKELLLLLGVAFLFVALARPHLFYQLREEQRTGFDVMLAVDCSKSMLTEDVKPSRLERAKLAIADFADRLPENRLGLIAFAGDAFLECPLTIDHEAFQDAVQDLDTDTIPRPGTDVASAIEEALQAEQSQPNNVKLLILITDGEDLEGRAIDAAHKAAEAGLKIYTVGVGTPAGGLIPERDENGDLQYLHDSSGQIVQSRLDEDTLKQIASITGGAYQPLGQSGEGLEAIYQQYIAPLPKQHFEERREKVRFEQYQWPLGLSLLCLAWSLLINERRARTRIEENLAPLPPVRRRRKNVPAGAVAVATLMLGLGFASRASAAGTDDAEKAYLSGQYDKAEQGYQDAAAAAPDRGDLRYNEGDAAYRAGDFSAAENAFRQALNTPDLGLQERSYYNLGNAQFRHGEEMQKADTKRTIELWKQALSSYDSSLKLRQTADAKHNYDVVKKRLEQLQQQQQQQQQNQQQQKNSSQDQQQQQSGQGSPQQQNGNGQQQPSQGGSGQQQQQNQQGQSPQNGQPQQDQNGQPQQPQNEQSGQQQGGQKQDKMVQARSAERDQDEKDPGAQSREEADALLDSLKDEEQRVTARSLNNGNDVPPPPSGKDW
jgi:Ca-activated chloride channel family protein